MKRITLTLALVLVVFPVVGDAQEVPRVTVPESMLTAEQKATLAVEQTADRVAQYGEWVGMGEEVGKAVSGALTAVTDSASKFADTKVGRLTVALVIWKVVARDAVGIVIGIPVLITFIVLWWRAYRRTCLGELVCVGRSDDGKRKYEYKEPTLSARVESGDLVSDRSAAVAWLWSVLAVGVLLCLLLIVP